MTSEGAVAGALLGPLAGMFCFVIFLSVLVHPSPGEVFTLVSSMRRSSLPCRKGQFTFHRIVWRNARQEGRGQNNGFCGNKAEKTHLPLVAACVLS